MNDYWRFSRRGLLEHMAQQNADILERLQTLSDLTQQETEDFAAVSAKLDTLATDVATAIAAKQSQIDTLTNELAAANAQLATAGQTITTDTAQIAADAAASAAASQAVVDSLAALGQKADQIDTTVAAPVVTPPAA